jgi:hypothetical protein
VAQSRHTYDDPIGVLICVSGDKHELHLPCGRRQRGLCRSSKLSVVQNAAATLSDADLRPFRGIPVRVTKFIEGGPFARCASLLSSMRYFLASSRSTTGRLSAVGVVARESGYSHPSGLHTSPRSAFALAVTLAPAIAIMIAAPRRMSSTCPNSCRRNSPARS